MAKQTTTGKVRRTNSPACQAQPQAASVKEGKKSAIKFKKATRKPKPISGFSDLELIELAGTRQGEPKKISDVVSYIFIKLVNRPASKLRKIDDQFQEQICQELAAAGFAKDLIDKAMSWLGDLLEQQLIGLFKQISSAQCPDFHRPGAVRCYNSDERLKLSQEVRGALFQLSQEGVLDWITQEIIITQLMALDQFPVGTDDLCWVAFIVICSSLGRGNQQEQHATLNRLLTLTGKTISLEML